MPTYLFSCSVASLLLLVGAHQIPLKDPASSPFTSAFDKLVADSLDRWHCPGLAIAVIDGDETFSKGYGIATFPSKPVTPDTLFYTASTTKSFTAAAVSLLIDDAVNSSSRKSLSWGTPLAKLMREDFVLPDDYTTLHATIEDALSHRTGMPGHDFSDGEPNVSVRDVVQNLRHLPMTAELRTRWQYCNMMYITISHFIQTWTGIWLGDFLRARIYEPLGMNNTFFSLGEAQAAASAGGAELATPYYWKNHTQRYHSLPMLDSPQVSGAGATISNVLDYTKWLRCHMTASPPLSPTGHLDLHTPRMIASIPEDGLTGFRGAYTYALGWVVSNYRGEEMHWHTGGLPGMVSIMAYFPRLQWGITMMGNGGNGGAQQVLIFELLDQMMGVPVKERYDWVPTLEHREAVALETLKFAAKLLYPNTPKDKDAIPLALPLEQYTGTYTNPGYPPLTLTLTLTLIANDTLHCTLPLEVWPLSLTFTHVSSSYFLLYTRFFTTTPRTEPDDYEIGTDMVSKAEFTLNEAGEVAELGVLLEPEMGDAKIWFAREGAGGGDSYRNYFAASAHVMSYDSYEPTSAGPKPSLFSRRPGQGLAPLFAKHG